MRYTETAAERFSRYVVRGPGCWLWSGGVNSHGYGAFWINGRTVSAHRAAWELANGPIPDGLFACHRCDTPLCVRLDHLFLGTPKENTVDMVQKGRGSPHLPLAPIGPDWHRTHDASVARGSRVGTSLLTEDTVRDIRARYAAGESRKSIGARYGIARQTVHGIVTRRSWAHVA
jgi:HNH endonuclease